MCWIRPQNDPCIARLEGNGYLLYLYSTFLPPEAGLKMEHSKNISYEFLFLMYTKIQPLKTIKTFKIKVLQHPGSLKQKTL